MDNKVVNKVVNEFVKVCNRMTNKGHYQVLCLEFDGEEEEFNFSIREYVPGCQEKDVFPLWVYKGGNKVSPVSVVKNRVELALDELEMARQDALGTWGRTVIEDW